MVARLGALSVAFIALTACNQQSVNRGDPNRSRIPLSAAVQQELAAKGMTGSDPVLVRIFKEESELEVWKKTGGSYKLFKTYPICKWSGELGPKIRQGDRQAPEGFYTITPAQMNPNSSYYLSFNLGFPNSFDRSYGRDGLHLMVHGDCSSMGCYAMTDNAIAEVYGMARDALAAGQPNFQVQAYPFRMNAKNLARHRTNPNMAFWKNLKEGHDHFMVTQQQPKVDVCERRYVFNSQSGGLSPSGSCAGYSAPESIVAAVREKDREDWQQVAAIAGSTALAPVRTGLDGGKHTAFGGIRLSDYNPQPAQPFSTAPVQAAKPQSVVAKAQPQAAPQAVEAAEAAPVEASPVAGTMAYAASSQPAGFASRLNPATWFGQNQAAAAPPVAMPGGAPMPLSRPGLKVTRLKAQQSSAGE